VNGVSYYCTFLAEIPACGYKIYYIIPKEKPKEFISETEDFKITNNSLENRFYRVEIDLQGQINVLDKKSDIFYEQVCSFEDVGDWGDEYDFSGPKENQTDLKFTSEDLNVFEIIPLIDGPTQKTMKLDLNLNLPSSLSEDRYNRDEFLESNLIKVYITLYKNIKRIDFKIELENKGKDHRIRVLFPSRINSTKVDCDGHFYVISRDTELPDAKNWFQKPLPTNHQKDFISVSDNSRTFSIINKGLPEYEAIKKEDGTITLAVTLLRCIEWLSRSNMLSRLENAGPDLNTPKAQCLGNYTFDLSLIIEENKPNWLDSKVHVKGKNFNNPLKVIFPSMVDSPIRTSDKVILLPFGLISGLKPADIKKSEPYLPTEFSFLEIDNNSIVLSALKKSEEEEYLILRCYNISSIPQRAKIKFFEKLHIKTAEIVNFLEQEPINTIKANLTLVNNNNLELSLEPHVIVTIKIGFN